MLMILCQRKFAERTLNKQLCYSTVKHQVFRVDIVETGQCWVRLMFTTRENRIHLKGKSKKKKPERSNKIDCNCLVIIIRFKRQLHAIWDNGYQYHTILSSSISCFHEISKNITSNCKKPFLRINKLRRDLTPFHYERKTVGVS